MPRDPRYDILFEPVQIGPVTAKNRFFQVPHCNGMGHTHPRAWARMREIKAEGGWAVVCSEACEIHPSSDLAPNIEVRLWDDGDIPMFARMADAVHEYGALVGIQTFHSGPSAACLYSRDVPLAPSHIPTSGYQPVQARAMDRSDIRAFRRWHRAAVQRAKRAEADIVYVYAAHGFSLPMFFLSRRYNQRSDEYGGSLENRARLMRELIEDAKEAVGDRCAVAVRFALNDVVGPNGLVVENEGREVVEMLAEVPDLWDVLGMYGVSSIPPARFVQQGEQEAFIGFVKQVTTKPVVGVDRFTSPDDMVLQIRHGVIDLIGAARPSIADPFLPRKVEEGRIEEIRECIGCNICASGDSTCVPMRCTQNPTMGEEWRRGWHPEWIEPKSTDDTFLIVGGGPAGLECAQALGSRGYRVTLAEASAEYGGRVATESRLPGLGTWRQVLDWRMYRLASMQDVEIYHSSRLTPADVLEFGASQVVIATGSVWRRDGVGRWHFKAIPGCDQKFVHTPDDVMSGEALWGPVVIFDDDHYYMGGVLAEKLRRDGLDVVLVTPAADVSTWTHATAEQGRIQSRLLQLGVEIVPHHALAAVKVGSVELDCVHTGRRLTRQAGSVVLVTARIPMDDLYRLLMRDPDASGAAGVSAITRIGDCLAPGTIAAAVHSGHLFARDLSVSLTDEVPFRRERAGVGDGRP
jgi:dimethylamine/trimethylamine dehydrogenase